MTKPFSPLRDAELERLSMSELVAYVREHWGVDAGRVFSDILQTPDPRPAPGAEGLLAFEKSQHELLGLCPPCVDKLQTLLRARLDLVRAEQKRWHVMTAEERAAENDRLLGERA